MAPSQLPELLGLESPPRSLVGITADLERRSRGPQRSRGSAAEAFLRQLAGLDRGLPPSDRSFIRKVMDRVRRGDLPDLPEAEPRADLLPQLPSAIRVWAARAEALAVELGARGEEAHARAAAISALHVAERMGWPTMDAFVAGRFHDHGRILLAQLAAEDAGPRETTLSQLSDGLHPALGAVLLERWGLSMGIQLAVENHHQPPTAVPRLVRPFAQIVRAADLLARVIVDDGRSAAQVAQSLERVCLELGIEPEMGLLDAILRDASPYVEAP